MRAGRLRKRIIIEERAATQDAAGQPVGAWTTFWACSADVQPLSGRELLAAQAVESAVSHRVRLRYTPGITAAMRINLGGGRLLNILAVRIRDERNRELELDCEEGLTDA